MAGKKIDMAALGEQATTTLASPVATEHAKTPTGQRGKRPPKPAPGDYQRFNDLERKETRLRVDQYDKLTELRRELNRQRSQGEGERITENTLIRIGIDMIIAQADNLHGVTEKELRKSIGL